VGGPPVAVVTLVGTREPAHHPHRRTPRRYRHGAGWRGALWPYLSDRETPQDRQTRGAEVRPCAWRVARSRLLSRRSAMGPAWITGRKVPPRPPLGVILFALEDVHAVTATQQWWEWV